MTSVAHRLPWCEGLNGIPVAVHNVAAFFHPLVGQAMSTSLAGVLDVLQKRFHGHRHDLFQPRNVNQTERAIPEKQNIWKELPSKTIYFTCQHHQILSFATISRVFTTGPHQCSHLHLDAMDNMTAEMSQTTKGNEAC